MRGKRLHLKEKCFQRDFLKALNGDGVLLAGLPPWLDRPDYKNHTTPFRSPWYSDFTPDIIFASKNNPTLVVELKYGNKYAPLAVPQALHQCWALDNAERLEIAHDLKKPFVPAVVAKWDPWSPQALAALRDRGLASDRLLYATADWIDFGGQKLVWLDDPFLPWEPHEAPIAHPALADFGHWYRVSGARTWIGLKEAADKRELVMKAPFAMVAEIRGQPGHVIWHGSYDEEGTYELVLPA